MTEARPTRFLCDEMLSGIGRWLRSAGYDTAIPARGSDDADLLAQARREGRVLLTRDKRLADADPSALLIASGAIDEQAIELKRALGVDWRLAPFTRCSVDNTPLQPAGSADLLRMPDESRLLPGPHQVCRTCGRVYWPGSHVRRMSARLERWAAD